MEHNNWIVVQTRVFTNWVNKVLANHFGEGAPQVTSLFTDLSSGVILMKLLEALFSSRGVKIPSYNQKPTMRPHYLDVVTQALNILPSVGVMTVFITPMQIVDGKDHPAMILGLIWRLILASQIVAIGESGSEILGGDERQIDGNARHSLLEWCRKRLEPYKSLKINNFGSDWQNGMAFIGLIHSQRPDLIDFNMLDPARAGDNLGLAFEMAFHEFGIPKLLEPGDLLGPNPDERCVMTYVSEFAYKFDILGRPAQDDGRARLLDEREQQLALREAQLEKEAAERLAAAANLGEEAQRIHAGAAQMAAQVEQERERLRRQEQENAAAAQRAQQELAARQAELDRQTGAEKARLQQEFDARQRALEEERAKRQAALEQERQAFLKQQEALAAERARLAQEGATFNSEKERFAAERAEHEKQMAIMKEQMARREEELNKREALDAIEKEFAEKANNIDAFIVAETSKVVGASSLQTLEPIKQFGVDHGQSLLDGLQECGGRAMKLGLQQNRYTKHTLKSLEERWATFKRELDERFKALAPQQQQYPQPPSQYGAFDQQYPNPPQQSQYGYGAETGPPPAPGQYPSAPTPGLGMPPQPQQQQYPTPGLGDPYRNQQQQQRPPQAPQQYAQPPPPQQQMQMQYGQQRPQTKVTTVHHYHQSAPQYPVVAPTYPTVYGVAPTYPTYPTYGY